jgi:hypothetical protein
MEGLGLMIGIIAVGLKTMAAVSLTGIVLNLCFEYVRRRVGGLIRGGELTKIK